MPRHPTLPRLSPTLLAMLASGALLSGCDLWGTDDTPTTAAATPAATSGDEAQVVQLEEASSANGSYLFGKTYVMGEVDDTDESGNPIKRSAPVGQMLRFVDPQTGAEAREAAITVDVESTQLVAQAFTMSADGLSQKAGNNVALFFTDAHKLYQVSLLRPTVPLKTQVPTDDNICQLLKVIPKNAQATSSWVMFTATRDADGSCSDQDQIITKVFSSDTTDSNSEQLSQVLSVLRDDQGNLLAVFGVAPPETTSIKVGDDTVNKVTRKLVSMDAAYGFVTEIDLGLDASLSATYIDRVAGSKTQAYVRVTNGSTINDLYVLDWSTGTLSLSRARVAPLTAGSSVFVHADATANYYLDGLVLKSIKPGNAPTALATLSNTVEAQPGGVMTASYLVIPQLAADGSGSISLQAFSKTTANSVRNIVLPVAGGSLRIEAHNGDVLIVSQTMDGNSTQATLWRVDLSQGAIGYTKLSDKATLISVTQAASETLTGEQQQAFVLWSEPSGGLLNLSSYQLSSKQTRVLGSSTPWDLAQATPQSITQGLLTSTTGSTDSLWLFDTASAASLKPISLPLPQ